MSPEETVWRAKHLRTLSGLSAAYLRALAERLARRSFKPHDSECRVWAGAKNQYGYPVVRVGGVQRVAHRVAWMLSRGDIPDGFEVDHACRNRGCINVAHLEPVTRAENFARMRRYVDSRAVSP